MYQKNGAQGVHKVAQGQNSKNQGAQGLGDPSPHKAAQGFFQYFCLVLRLVRALCGHSLLSLCKQGARFVEVLGRFGDAKKARGTISVLHKAGTRQNQGKPIPCTRCPQKQNTSATVAQGGAQGGAQGDAQG